MHEEPAGEAIARIANEAPGTVTLVALAPLTTIAAALELEPGLPALLDEVVVMGGAVAVPGNVTAVSEANIGHDPDAAAFVIDAFGAPGARAGRRPPCLVPLDVTLRAPLTAAELDAVVGSRLPGASTVHAIWTAIWPTGLIELGPHGEGSWPCHDLIALWTLLDRECFTWHRGPLTVDTGRSAAWGATVLDRRTHATADDDAGWDVALHVDAERLRRGVREWLQGCV
jgi:purine nucleosidase